MNKAIRLRAILFAMLICAFAQSACVHAQTTVMVVDETDPVPPQPHSQSFSNQLVATVTDPPQSNAELTVNSGPSWSWAVSPTTFQLGNTGTDSVTLSNVTLPLPAGSNDIVVTATATYSVTDNSTGQPNTYNVQYTSAPCDIVLEALVPDHFTEILYSNEYDTTGSYAYGHKTLYLLTCISDYQNMPYTAGSAVESFSNIEYNPLYASDIPAHGGVGSPNSYPLDTIEDNPGAMFDLNSMTDSAWGLSNPNTGASTLWAQLDQTLSVNDVTPATVCSPVFTIYHDQDEALRNP